METSYVTLPATGETTVAFRIPEQASTGNQT